MCVLNFILFYFNLEAIFINIKFKYRAALIYLPLACENEGEREVEGGRKSQNRIGVELSSSRIKMKIKFRKWLTRTENEKAREREQK